MIWCLSNARSGDLQFGASFIALRALVREIIPNRGKRPYYAHLTGKRILWPNHWLHGDNTLAGYRLDNCLSMPKYKSFLSLQHFRQYLFSGGSALEPFSGVEIHMEMGMEWKWMEMGHNL